MKQGVVVAGHTTEAPSLIRLLALARYIHPSTIRDVSVDRVVRLIRASPALRLPSRLELADQL